MNNFDCFIYNNGGMFLDLRLNYLNKYIDKSIIVVPKYKFLLKFWGLIGKKSMILVTGSAGYLGSHICKKLLDKNIPFYSIDNLSSGKFENVFRKGFFSRILLNFTWRFVEKQGWFERCEKKKAFLRK